MERDEYRKDVINITTKIKVFVDNLYNFLGERRNWIFDKEQLSLYNIRACKFNIEYHYDNDNKVKSIDKEYSDLVSYLYDFKNEYELRDLSGMEVPDMLNKLILNILSMKFETKQGFTPDSLLFPKESEYGNGYMNPWYPTNVVFTKMKWFEHTGKPNDRVIKFEGIYIQSSQDYVFPDKPIKEYIKSDEYYEKLLSDIISNVFDNSESRNTTNMMVKNY